MSLKTVNLIWPYVVLIFAPVSLCVNAYEWSKNPNWNELRILFTFNLLALNTHQIEKFIYPGKFMKRFNSSVFQNQNQNKKNTPLSEGAIFSSEMIYLFSGVLSIIFEEKFPYLGLFTIGFSSLTLILCAIKYIGRPRDRDTVGCLTGVFFFFPINTYTFIRCLKVLGLIYSIIATLVGILAAALFLLKIYQNLSADNNFEKKKTALKSK